MPRRVRSYSRCSVNTYGMKEWQPVGVPGLERGHDCVGIGAFRGEAMKVRWTGTHTSAFPVTHMQKLCSVWRVLEPC